MLARTSLYALQALLHLAQKPRGASASAAQMADELGVPRDYLAKVLHRLTREGLLVSRRGVHGGYRLAIPADALRVERVVEPFEELHTSAICLLGGPCDPEDYCSAHAHRLAWAEVRRSLLARTMLADLLVDPPAGPDGPVTAETPATKSDSRP